MQVTRLFDYINKQFDEGTLEKFARNKTEQS